MTTRLLKNCRILEKGKLIKVNILIKDGKIQSLLKKPVKADETIDIKNKIILPGLIDPHVHLRDPGLTHKEDFLSGSMAAAKGGITTFLEMPNTIPPTITVEDLEEKRKIAKKSVINYGFHFGSTPNNLSEIKKAKNIASVKVFMNVSTGDMKVKDTTLANIMKNTRLTSVHAEEKAVDKAISLIKKTKNNLYLCHISLKSELNAIKKGKNSQIFVEATPHHLFLTKDDEKKLKTFGLMKPNLRSKEDQAALWKAIKEGIIDTIGTDHAPHTKEEKETSNPFGIPGVETLLPLLLDAVNKKKITLNQLQKLCCENPAKIFRIKNKGFIKKGYDADLTIIDLNKTQKVTSDKILSKCGWSPFEGKTLKGWPVMTIVNGNIIYDGSVYDIKAKEVKYDN